MNIQTVRDNLLNTIAGKEALLANYVEREQNGTYPAILMFRGMCDMLEINIAELKRILQDVEQLVPYREADAGAYGPEYQGQ